MQHYCKENDADKTFSFTFILLALLSKVNHKSGTVHATVETKQSSWETVGKNSLYVHITLLVLRK